MATVENNPLRALCALGQSVWLDDLGRDLIESGELARRIDADGVSGVTSNPAIFEKAITQGEAYGPAIRERADAGSDAKSIYEALALADVRAAADLLAPVYRGSSGVDGYVSLEVSPHLAHDADATVAEARRLWRALDRPNVMIKVPGTQVGLDAIRALISEGINVNVTLLFGVERYRQVAEAFLDGLDRRAAAGQSVDHVGSVASFFISRIDTLVDARLDALATTSAQALRGRAAIAAAQLAHRAFRASMADARWQRLANLGARPQRLLWASTSNKDPRYPDTRYVDGLIIPGTVNTMPRNTLDAFRDHGRAAPARCDAGEAESVWAELGALGLEPGAISRQLEREGVDKFVDPFDRLLEAIGRRMRHAV